jgi:eukaryotic-like serine/threonine-protein kinase
VRTGVTSGHYLPGGRYRLVTPVGPAVAETVWLAADEVLDRDVAVTPVPVPPDVPEADREEARLRALREARDVTQAQDLAPAGLTDLVLDGDTAWLVAPYVPGRTLAEVIAQDGPLPPAPAVRAAAALLGALRAAHTAGVLHRDVTPSRVLVDERGQVLLTGFGAARFTADLRRAADDGEPPRAGSAAPELAGDLAAATASSDLWALGATLYEAVEGRPPVGEPTAAGLGGSGPLAPLISGLLRDDPSQRFDADQAGRALAEAELSFPAGELAPSPQDRPSSRHRRRASQRRRGWPLPRVLGTALIAGAVAAAGIYLVGSQGETDQPEPRPGAAPVPVPRPTTNGPLGTTPPRPAPGNGLAPRLIAATEPYVDAPGRFSLQVPAGWRRTRGAGNTVLFTAPGSGARPDLNVIWTEEGVTPQPTDVSQRESERRLLTEERPRGYRRLSVVTTRTPAGQATDWQYTYVRDDAAPVQTWRVAVHIFFDGERYFDVTLRLPEEQWAANSAAAGNVLRSLTTRSA